MRWVPWAASALLFSACNLPSALLVAATQGDGAPQLLNLDVKFQPGLPIVTAAGQAPAALRHVRDLSARFDLSRINLTDGAALADELPDELLNRGMLLPLPIGVLQIRTVSPEPVVAVPTLAIPLSSRQLAEIVGAYGADKRVLVLSTDGTYLLRTGSTTTDHGTFTLAGNQLSLTADGDPVALLVPMGSDGWLAADGATYYPLKPTPIESSERKRGARR